VVVNVTEKQLKKLIRKLDLARSAVFVSAQALDAGDTDLELQSATVLKKAFQTMDRVYDALLSVRLDAESDDPVPAVRSKELMQ
jgi:hypothetical protein